MIKTSYSFVIEHVIVTVIFVKHILNVKLIIESTSSFYLTVCDCWYYETLFVEVRVIGFGKTYITESTKLYCLTVKTHGWFHLQNVTVFFFLCVWLFHPKCEFGFFLLIIQQNNWNFQITSWISYKVVRSIIEREKIIVSLLITR